MLDTEVLYYRHMQNSTASPLLRTFIFFFFIFYIYHTYLLPITKVFKHFARTKAAHQTI